MYSSGEITQIKCTVNFVLCIHDMVSTGEMPTDFLFVIRSSRPPKVLFQCISSSLAVTENGVHRWGIQFANHCQHSLLDPYSPLQHEIPIMRDHFHSIFLIHDLEHAFSDDFMAPNRQLKGHNLPNTSFAKWLKVSHLTIG